MDRFKDVIYLNKVFTSIYGYQKEDINPFDKWVSEAFPFAKAEEIDYYVRLIFEDETDIDEKDSLIIKIRGKSGEHFYSKFYKKVIGNKIVLILENITEEIKRKKKTELINTLLRINTEINREIAKIEDSVAIIRKTIELFLRSKILKSICAFTFTGANYRKLVMIDEKEEIKYFDDSMTPDCVLESVKADGKIIIRKTADNCVNCKIKNEKNDEITIIVPFQNNRIFYGNLIIFTANEMFTDDDILSILGGIAKDIALRIDNLALQKQNRDYIERIKSIARFPAENPNPLVRIDRNGILLYANPASQEIISFWKSSIGSSIPDNIKNYVDIAFETSNKYETEFYLNDRIYYVYIVPFHDSGYANLYFIDITEKKKQELALRESEDRLRRILDVAPFGIYIVNSDYDITYLNPFVEKSLGKVNGRKCYEYFNDFDSPCDFCQMEKVKNGETIKRTFEAPKTNRIYELIDIPYKNPDGSISKLQIFNDITEIKNAERMIRESEEKFRKLFNEAPVGYYLQGENGVFIDGNAVAERLTGYKKEELIGKNFLETGLIPEDKINEAFDFFRRSILEGNSGPFEMEIIRKDGNRTTLEIFVRYIELGGKKVILGIASDISDRIRMQNEIIKANRELERLSDGLKQEVEKQTEKIRKSEKMAIIIKNVILTVSNLISEEEILKESAYYLSEQLGFKAFGYYISEKGDYNINFFVNHGLCNVETDFQSFNENVLKYLARNYYNTLKPRRILKEDLNFFPEFAEKFEQNCQEIVLIPVIYKDISLGFMLFFLAKGTDNDAIMMDAFEQLSLQIGTIIEQKRADAKRERLSKLYESVLNSAGDGIVGTDNNLNIIFANKSALNILGYIEREIIGENIHRILHSGTDTELHRIEECPIRNSLQLASEIKSEDEIFFKSNGDKINVKTIITPIVENGESTGVVVAFSDITDEKKRRDEINRLATALNQYPVAIGFIDKAGNIRYVNEAFERHTGYSKA
ncbi:MAG: PAS domain S-box protein, partial [Deltaproteobacteria bacterium]|nr:PAS domain S-box protein [Deltaproteobacteria bacterium]